MDKINNLIEAYTNKIQSINTILYLLALIYKNLHVLIFI